MLEFQLFADCNSQSQTVQFKKMLIRANHLRGWDAKLPVRNKVIFVSESGAAKAIACALYLQKMWGFLLVSESIE